MWIDYFKYRYCIYRDTLFIKGVAEDNTDRKAFSLPIGAMPLAESVALLRHYCEERGRRLVFSAIPDERIDEFRALNPICVTPLNHWADYIYSIEALASLAGKKLSKKRNHTNHFAIEYPDAVFEPISDLNMEAVHQCFTEVCAVAKDTPMADFERAQVWRVLRHLHDYPFETACLRIGDKVIAFTIGEVIGTTLYVHIEKTLHEYSGANETINRRFCQFIKERFPRVTEVNREDDAGDSGLQQSKQSYYPLRLLTKYNVAF